MNDPSNSNEVFFSLPCPSIPGLRDVARLSRELMTVPEGFDSKHYQNLFEQDPQFREERAEVYSKPDTAVMFRREAESALKRTTRAIRQSREIDKRPAVKEWEVLEGMINWDDGPNARSANLREAVSEFFGEPCRSVGDFLYPPRGYRSWHTNKFESRGDQWVMFLVQVDCVNGSFFKYVDPHTGDIHTSWDQSDCVNFMLISSTNLLWHCVASESAMRWSQGFRIPADWRKRVGI